MRRDTVKCLSVALLCMSSMHQHAASEVASKVKQLAIIPNFLTPEGLKTTTEAMDTILARNKTYCDYGRRKGGIWSDCWVNPNNPELTGEAEGRVRLTQVSEQLERGEKPESRVPESLFDYPELQAVVTREMLPTMFTLIKTRKWAALPEKAFVQFYLQSCSDSDAMDWHQDPGEPEWDPMADFSLVLMLGDQWDPVHGWKGGKFRIRPGKPYDTNPAEPTTIVHKPNQGLLFNNVINCHRAEAVTGTPTSRRDLIVICLYLKKAPEAVPEFDQRAFFAKIAPESKQ